MKRNMKISIIFALSILMCCACGKSDKSEIASKEITTKETTTQETTTQETATQETTTQETTTQEETTTQAVKELVWIEEPKYDYDKVEALVDIFPQSATVGLEKCGDYTSRVFVYKDNKVGLADYKGNLYIDLNEELHLDPRTGIVGKHQYDINGNNIGSAGGAGGASFVWNERNNTLLFVAPGTLEVYNEITLDYMCVVSAIDKNIDNLSIIEMEQGIQESEHCDWYRLINKDGSLVTNEKFEEIKCDASMVGNVVGDYAVVKKDGKWGYVKSDGTWLIECKYDDACPFVNGIAAVKENGKAGFIYEDGTVAYDFIFEETSSVYDNKAWVKYEGKWGVVSLTGEVEDFDVSEDKEKVLDAYTDAIKEQMGNVGDWFFGIASISMSDITGDGIEELYVVYESGRGGQGYIFVYSESGVGVVGSPNNAAGGHYFETYKNKETGELRIIKVWMGNGMQDYEINDFNNKGELVNKNSYMDMDYDASINDGFERLEWNASFYKELNKTAGECNKDNIKEWLVDVLNTPYEGE